MCKKTIVTCAITVLCLMAFAQEEHGRHRPNGGERPHRHARGGENGDRKMHRSSESGERRRPQLNEETRKLIAAYRRDPTETNKSALRKQVEADYEKRIERKKAELAELKRSAGSESQVKEMEGELDEMIQSRDRRIDQMMSRFRIISSNSPSISFTRDSLPAVRFNSASSAFLRSIRFS